MRWGLPTSGWNTCWPANPADFGWLTEILPFIEQNPLYKSVMAGNTAAAPGDAGEDVLHPAPPRPDAVDPSGA